MESTLIIPSKQIEIQYYVDVLVAGGGPAGVGAAVSAARQGLKLLLIESRAFLGGNITACYVETCNHYMFRRSESEKIIQATGIYAEIEAKYQAVFGRSDDIREDFPAFRFSSEYLKVFLDEFVINANVHVLYHTKVSDVIVEDGSIKGVILDGVSGPIGVQAKIVIDATGDGNVAYMAGAPFEKGNETLKFCQPGTVNFRITGVNVKEVAESGGIGAVMEDFRKKMTELNLPFPAGRGIPCGRMTQNGQVSYINYIDAYQIDPTCVEDVTKGEIECRRKIIEFFGYLQKYAVGFENAELVSIAPTIGFRDSRRIVGRYKLTKEDVDDGRKFDDGIGIFPKFYDVVSLTGAWKWGEDCFFNHSKDGDYFTVPYRSMVPVNIDNLIVAGRCISTDHMAESAVRAIYCCMCTGQAAGTAAAIAIESETKIGDININELRKRLSAQGVALY